MDAEPYLPLIDHYWKNLFCIHFKIPKDLLRPHLHPSIGIDTWENNAYIGIFGLQLENVHFYKIPLLQKINYRSIVQLNIRTYVKNLQNEPAVYFFRLNATSRLGCFLAKCLYKLPYIHSLIQYRYKEEKGTLTLFRKKTRHTFSYEVTGNPFPATEDPLASFFLERPKFNTTLERNELYEGIIKHAPFQIQRINVLESSLSIFDEVNLPSSSMALAPNAHFFSKGMRVLLNDFYRVQ